LWELFYPTKGVSEASSNGYVFPYPFFNTVYIVPFKNGGRINHILNTHHLEKDETILIGDSVRDDIASAVESGIDSILIKSDKPSWAYEDAKYTPTYTLSSIAELPSIISL
jgi:phosphoglycolate phosphatase-like HAD superfamily hydrolase